MAEQDLKFRVTADIKELESALAKVKKSLGETESATNDVNEELEKTKAASGNAASGFANIAAKGFVVVAAVQQIAEQMASFETTMGVVNRFSGDISEASKRVSGLASDVSLMATQQAIANRGLVLGTRDFANFAVAVQEYAAATGKDAVAVQEEFAEAVGTGAAEALNKFGIQVDATKGKVDIQREALKELEEKFGDVNSSADTMAGQLGTLKNRFSNLTIAMEKGLGAAIEADTGLAKINTTLQFSIDFWEGFQAAVVISFGTIVGAAKGFVADLQELGAAIGTFANAVKKSLSGDIKGSNKELDKISSSAFTLDKTLITAHKAASATSDALLKLKDSGKSAATAISETGVEAEKAAGKINGLKDATDAWIDGLANTPGGQALFVGAIEEATAEAEVLKETLEEAKKAATFSVLKAPTEGGAASTVKTGSEIDEANFKAARENASELQNALHDLFHTGTTTAEEFASGIVGALGTVESAIGSAIEAVVSGEASMSEAFERMVANILVSLGNQLVADGLKNVFLGLGRILTSYGGDVTGGSLVALGGAEIAGGVALGAAGAAISPTSSGGGAGASAATPQGGQDNSQAAPRGEQTIVVNVNSPVPKEYVGRTTNQATRAAARRGID